MQRMQYHHHRQHLVLHWILLHTSPAAKSHLWTEKSRTSLQKFRTSAGRAHVSMGKSRGKCHMSAGKSRPSRHRVAWVGCQPCRHLHRTTTDHTSPRPSHEPTACDQQTDAVVLIPASPSDIRHLLSQRRRHLSATEADISRNTPTAAPMYTGHLSLSSSF